MAITYHPVYGWPIDSSDPFYYPSYVATMVDGLGVMGNVLCEEGMDRLCKAVRAVWKGEWYAVVREVPGSVYSVACAHVGAQVVATLYFVK